MRFLHTMLRVGDLQRSIDFYTKVLGMNLLRTTERPEQKYSLAFVGYGTNPEHAELELTYNHGVPEYEMGTAFGHLAIGVPDAYAACDLVTFPSTGGEGFGQPVIESVWANRPLAVLRYPALDEILALGFSFLPADDPDAVAAALRDASLRDGLGPVAARNRELAQTHFSMKALERALEALLRTR